jgi:uncharacterized protein
MPHQCVRCGSLYEDGSDTILKGCSCNGKLFFYVKKERLDELQKEEANLTDVDKQQIEEDVFDLIGSQIDKEKPVVLDFEAIRVLKPGKYELDLVSLFRKQPLIFRLEEGKYMIDIQSTFDEFSSKKKKK